MSYDSTDHMAQFLAKIIHLDEEIDNPAASSRSFLHWDLEIIIACWIKFRALHTEDKDDCKNNDQEHLFRWYCSSKLICLVQMKSVSNLPWSAFNP